MKPFFTSTFVVFITILLAACSQPSKLSTVPLTLDEEKISLEFQQNNSNIPVSGKDTEWNLTLKPEPFTLILDGDKKIVSVMVLKSAGLIAPLQQSALVTTPGTGLALSKNNLYVSDQPIEVYEINMYTLQNLSYFSFTAEKAIKTASILKKQFNATPQVLISGHAYIYASPDQGPSYVINTLNGKPIEGGSSVVLLVFIKKQSDDPNFSVLKWIRFNLKFE